MLRTVVMTYFYSVDDKERKIAVDLFRKNSLNAHTFREESDGMGDYYSNMYKDRIENDAFHFLDTFADRRDYMLLVTNGHFKVEEKKTEEIFNLARKRSLFEVWED